MALTQSAGFQPYPPSWVDRLQVLVERQPRAYWVYYLAAWVILFGLAVGVQWLGDNRFTLPIWVILLLISGWPIYLFGGMHYLDLYAASAFEAIEPSLRLDEQSRQSLKYQLTTLPASPTLWISLGYMGLEVVRTLWNAHPANLVEVFGAGVYLAFQALGNLVSAAFVYHALHQLSAIRTLYAACSVSPLRPHSLYALSGLALRNAFIMISFTYALYATSSDQDRSELLLQVVFPVALVSGALFIAPLWGVHQMLLKEKGRLQDQAAQQLEAVIAELHQKVENKQFSEIDGLNKALGSLQTELNILDKTTTWPWQPDTPRLLLTAILLPILVWLAQRILGRIGL